MNRPRISVLTPAYNAASYIQELLDSVRGQSYPAHEHIVIDDGSTDDTSLILKDSPGVTMVRRENRGQYATQNELLKLATGDVLVLISADDYFSRRDAFDRVARAFGSSRQTDVVVGRTPRRIEGDPSFVARPDVPLWLGIRSLRSCLAVQHCSVFVRRSLILENQIWFDPTYRMAGDWVWLLDVFQAASRVRAINVDLGTWRMHSAQTSRVGMAHGFEEKDRVVTERNIGRYRARGVRFTYEKYAQARLAGALLRQHGVTSLLRKLGGSARTHVTSSRSRSAAPGGGPSRDSV